MLNSTPHVGTVASWLLSLALVVLVAAAIAGWATALFSAIVTSAFVPGIMLQRMFPSSRLLGIAFVNLVAAYASVFAVSVEEAFVGVGPLTLSAGFVLPILSFLAGCWVQQNRIKGGVRASQRRQYGS